MSQISQLSISLSLSPSLHRPPLPVIHLPPSLPQLPVPQQPNLLLGHFCDKSPFLLFLPAPGTKQTWRQCSQKGVASIIYPKSGFGRASASIDSGGGPCGGGLAASYTWTSTDSDSTLLSSRLQISSDLNRLSPDLFSLINPQQSVQMHRTERDRTAGKIPVQLALLQV